VNPPLPIQYEKVRRVRKANPMQLSHLNGCHVVEGAPDMPDMPDMFAANQMKNITSSSFIFCFSREGL
jgi:hypothetical protein